MKRSDIYKLKKALQKAEKLYNILETQKGKIASIIEDATGVIGFVDHLHGDGFGFTPEKNNDTYVGIDEIIEWATKNIDINEEYILNNLTF